MKIYCISGLGADERAFQNLKAPGHEFKFIHYLSPQPDEELPHYAERLKLQIDIKVPFALLGVSFGGVVAIELSRIVPAKAVFLISSIPHSLFVPRKLRWASWMGLPKWFSRKLPAKFDFVLNYAFGAEQEQGRKLLKQIVLDTDPQFLKWALSALNQWYYLEKSNCIRIHGTRDHLIPLKGKVHYPIQGGGHWIIYEQGEQISSIIANHLNEN